MSEFCGINTFGNLTANGRKLTFDDFDTDNNGVISKSEYDTVLKEMKLDRVEISVVDKNDDKTISKDEFALWGQKIQMQDSINALAATISKDFTGKTECLIELTNALKDLIEEYASEYKGDVSKMAEKFESVLPAKYQALKTLILETDTSSIKSKVLDEIYIELISPLAGKKDVTSETAAQRIIKELETEADKFIKTYKGTHLEIELKAHLKDFMNKSDAEKLKDAAKQFKTNSKALNSLTDEKEKLKQLKECTKEFLTTALDNGVTIKLDYTIIKTTNAITSVLARFNDSNTLQAAIENIIANLDTKTFKERLIAEEESKAIAAEEKKFTDIKGYEYIVDTNLINYSNITGYSDNGTISKKAKKSTEELKENVKQQMIDIINNTLKSQIKKQIQNILKSKGVPFEKIEKVFENTFNSSLVETLNTNGMIETKHKTWFTNGSAKINIKQCVDQFIVTFNTNISGAIDKINTSDKDFDTVDLDLTKLNTNGNGSKIETVNNDDIVKSYQTGIPLRTNKKGADYYINIAEQIIDGLKAQIMTKAKTMCAANGVKFDERVFNTLFSEVKDLAVNACVAGCDKKGKAWNNSNISKEDTTIKKAGAITAGAVGGLSGAAGLTMGAAVLGAGGIISDVGLGIAVGLASIGPVGWIAGGALLVGGILAGIFGFGGNKSQSVLDTRSLVDGFTETFAQNFSKWVEEEKAT